MLKPKNLSLLLYGLGAIATAIIPGMEPLSPTLAAAFLTSSELSQIKPGTSWWT
ncbi:hypothetical protein [Spiroplasma alleghenense]|uniref:hypothetical protein n=1 Tax=Spiroplasma alleghenense TaxID=216931 RepID=UPI0013B376D0|nr:hypothetical protein [Spiroplasma alleghenense]